VAHVVAVTKAGRLYTWGNCSWGCLGHNNNSCNELRPKRVEHGGFAELFIVCATAGHFNLAAIDSSGLVPILYFSTILDIATLQFILNHYLRCCYLSYGPLDMMQFIL
jgi:alpha-tubulin suppressor-like RCC1 family protein